MLTIRLATDRDVGALAALHVLVWRTTYKDLAPRDAYLALDESRRREHWQELLRRGESSVTLVAEEQGEIVAFGHAGPASHPALGDAGEIVHLYVRSDMQGRGLGAELMARLAAFLTEHGHSVVRLSVVKGNDQAIRFYERSGGARVGEFEDGVLWRSTNLMYEWSNPSALIHVAGRAPAP